jgi:hypothetical protein
MECSDTLRSVEYQSNIKRAVQLRDVSKISVAKEVY